MAQDIALRSSIEQVVAFKDRAIELYDEAWRKIEEADKAIRAAHAMGLQASPGLNCYNHGHADEIKEFYAAVTLPDRDKYTRVARRLLELNVWAWVIERTDLERLMDKEAKDKLREQMQYIPERTDRDGQLINEEEIARGLPPATVDNIYSTIQTFMAESDMIFRRGIANTFTNLDRRFRSHDGFKVGSRVILTRVFNEYGGFSYSSRHRDTLIDIERAFSILDGKDGRSFTSGVIALEESRRGGGYAPRQSVTETEYFRIQGFKNGNAHLWFTRDDLVQRINQILAEWYGEVIGDGRTRDDPLSDAKTTLARNFGFFPTPKAACEFVLNDFSVSGRVLEPSAGTGNLARLCVGCAVDCIEIQPELADSLRREGIYNRVMCHDFLKVAPRPEYDCVVMNPPFDRERDIDHVMHALKFLKPDGRLVAIMSAGTEFRQTRKSVVFRNFMKSKNARFRDLPERSFSEMGTNVNTISVYVWNDGDADRWLSRSRTFEDV